jgi:hypothetical protein
MIHKKCLRAIAEKSVRGQGELACPECSERISQFEIRSIFGEPFIEELDKIAQS